MLQPIEVRVQPEHYAVAREHRLEADRTVTRAKVVDADARLGPCDQ